MKLIIILFTLIGISSSIIDDDPIEPEDLKATCKVLVKSTSQAIDNNRHDLVAIYYNTYKAIRLKHTINPDCDTYFDEIKSGFEKDVGDWSVRLDFPPQHMPNPTSGNFTNEEIETLYRIKESKLTIDDLDFLELLKGVQENNIDVNILKRTNTDNIKLINDNLNRMSLENIDQEKLNSLNIEKVKIEQFQKIIHK